MPELIRKLSSSVWRRHVNVGRVVGGNCVVGDDKHLILIGKMMVNQFIMRLQVLVKVDHTFAYLFSKIVVNRIRNFLSKLVTVQHTPYLLHRQQLNGKHQQ